MSVYPSALDDLTQPHAGEASRKVGPDLDEARSAINAIEAELGLDPAGAEATVAERIAATESVISGINTSFTAYPIISSPTYTAVVGDYVIGDASPLTVTLPSAPTNGSRIGVVAVSGAMTVTGGAGDAITANSLTSITLAYGQFVWLEYDAALHTWLGLNYGPSLDAITGKGQIFAGTNTSQVDVLVPGANNTVLTADSAQPVGIKWSTLSKTSVGLANVDNTSDANKPVSSAAQTALNAKAATAYVDSQDGLLIPKASIDAKGDILVGTANDTVVRKAAGANGQILSSNSAQSDGLSWVDRGPSGALMKVGKYFANGYSNGGGVKTNGDARTTRITIGRTCTLDAIAVEVVTTPGGAGSVTRLGIYADDNGYPGALILDAGTVDTTTVGIKVAAISFAIAAGAYWLVAAVQGGATPAPTLRTSNTITQGDGAVGGTDFRFVNSGVSGGILGALPASFNIAGGDITYMIAIKASA